MFSKKKIETFFENRFHKDSLISKSNLVAVQTKKIVLKARGCLKLISFSK